MSQYKVSMMAVFDKLIWCFVAQLSFTVQHVVGESDLSETNENERKSIELFTMTAGELLVTVFIDTYYVS